MCSLFLSCSQTSYHVSSQHNGGVVGGGSIAAPPPLFQGRLAAALRRCHPIPPVLQKLHYHVDTGGASTTDRMEAHPGRGAGAMTSR
jgi:hypothetical protein